MRVHAFIRTHPDAVLCRESAAVIHGLPRFGEARDIHIFDPGRTSSRRFGDVSVHTSCDAPEVVRVHGIHATSILDTAVDLVRALPPAQALAVADAAVSPAQGGALTVDELRERGDAQRNNRGRAMLRWTLARADGLSESPAESVSRAVIEWSGFERPELQRRFAYEGLHDRVDFFFASCRAVGESDGWQKYDFTDLGAAARQLADEKRREDRLRRNGHPFARWDLRDAWRVQPLCRALSSAGVPLVAPSQHALLATLTNAQRRAA